MHLYTTLWNINVRKPNDNNKHLSKWKNTSYQHCGEWSVLDPHSLVSYGSFTAMLILSIFFIILPNCLFVIIVIHAYFIDISQGSVETHLWRGGIYNNHIIANCPQSVSVKEYWESVINWRRYGHKLSATFFMAHHIHHTFEQCLKQKSGKVLQPLYSSKCK